MLDLQAYRKRETLLYLIDCLGLALCAVFPSLLIAIVSTQWKSAALYGMLAVLWALPAAYALGALCYWVRSGKRIRAGRFSIAETTLSSIGEMEISFRRHWHIRWISRYFRYVRYDRYAFHFYSYGKYVPPRQNFTWSETFHMRDEGLANTSLSGDTFYLLLAERGKRKEQTIVYAYPAKFFERENGSAQE